VAEARDDVVGPRLIRIEERDNSAGGICVSHPLRLGEASLRPRRALACGVCVEPGVAPCGARPGPESIPIDPGGGRGGDRSPRGVAEGPVRLGSLAAQVDSEAVRLAVRIELGRLGEAAGHAAGSWKTCSCNTTAEAEPVTIEPKGAPTMSAEPQTGTSGIGRPHARGTRSSPIAQFGADRGDLAGWALTTGDPLADAVVADIHDGHPQARQTVQLGIRNGARLARRAGRLGRGVPDRHRAVARLRR